MGDAYILQAFFIVILGGLGSFRGAFMGGLIFGVVNNIIAWYLSASIGSIFAYFMVILLMWLKPEGIFGRA